MASTSLVKRSLAPAWVRPEALNVTPDLLGMPLAPNGRRALAILVDVALIGVLSTTGMFWSVAGVGALAVQLRRRTPRRPLWRTLLMWLALAWLAIVAFGHGADWLLHRDNPARVAAAVREEGVDEDDDAGPAAAAVTALASAPASVYVGASAAPASTVQARQSARIAALEAQLAAARKPHSLSWRDELQRQLQRLGLSFGWAIAYFTLLPYWWKGQTVGKRLSGLRVVELTGKPLSLMTCFGRYGGYAAGLATGGMGFVQVLWDPNRQAVQDKLAHTVVVDLRAPRAS